MALLVWLKPIWPIFAEAAGGIILSNAGIIGGGGM